MPKSYDAFDRETADLVARLVKNRSEAKKKLAKCAELPIPSRHKEIIAEVKNSSFGLLETGDSWKVDWQEAFDKLTGPLLLGGGEVPLWDKEDGKMMLELWANSWRALDSAAKFSCAVLEDNDEHRSHKFFEKLFRGVAKYSIARLKKVAELHVSSVAEMDFIDSRAFQQILAAANVPMFDFPGNAMHMWPKNYGIGIQKSVDIAICLPESFKDCRSLTACPPGKYSAEDQILDLVERDVIPLHLSQRGASDRQAWEASAKQLVVLVPAAEAPKQSWWWG
ncbi:hypothetical protein EON64_18300, partial [archaeon]